MRYENIDYTKTLGRFIFYEYNEYYGNLNAPSYLTALDGALNCTLHGRLKPMNEMTDKLETICHYYSLSDSVDTDNPAFIEDVRRYVLKPYWKDIQDACDKFVDECNESMHRRYPKMHFEIK